MSADHIASPPHSPTAARLVDLMHAERPTGLTTQFLAREKHQAPALSGNGSSAASGQSPASGRLLEPAARPSKDGDDSMRWAADSQPTNLLWQNIGSEQKQHIFNAMSNRGDLPGIQLWEHANQGDIRAMDRLDDHLLQHYHKHEEKSGEANPLRFPQKEPRGASGNASSASGASPRSEATPEDTRAYMRTKQPLLDANRERLKQSQAAATKSDNGLFKTLFKRDNKKA